MTKIIIFKNNIFKIINNNNNLKKN